MNDLRVHERRYRTTPERERELIEEIRATQEAERIARMTEKDKKSKSSKSLFFAILSKLGIVPE